MNELEAADDQGWCPLHYACFVGCDAIVELLCERGVTLASRIPNGSTPLHIAAGADFPSVVKALTKFIRDKSTFTLVNDEKQTAAQLCKMIGSPNHVECLNIIANAEESM